MMGQDELQLHEPGPDAALLSRLFARCDRVLVKKLSNNDRDWAQLENKHQNAVYIPRGTARRRFFFPVLKPSSSPDKTDSAHEIREPFLCDDLATVGCRKVLAAGPLIRAIRGRKRI